MHNYEALVISGVIFSAFSIDEGDESAYIRDQIFVGNTVTHDPTAIDVVSAAGVVEGERGAWVCVRDSDEVMFLVHRLVVRSENQRHQVVISPGHNGTVDDTVWALR